MEIIIKYTGILYVTSLMAFIILGFIFKTYCQYNILKSSNKPLYSCRYAQFYSN